MLYYNTTTDKRYNERTLALYGFTPEDNDVHELTVDYPEVDPLYETYRDTQRVTAVGRAFSVKFEIIELPKARIVTNIRDRYVQSVYILRHGIVTVEGHDIQSPVLAIDTFAAWRSAINSGITFKPALTPFADTAPEVTVPLIDALVAGIEAHLSRCDEVRGQIGAYLDQAEVAALKATSPQQWVTHTYNALNAA